PGATKRSASYPWCSVTSWAARRPSAGASSNLAGRTVTSGSFVIANVYRAGAAAPITKSGACRPALRPHALGQRRDLVRRQLGLVGDDAAGDDPAVVHLQVPVDRAAELGAVRAGDQRRALAKTGARPGGVDTEHPGAHPQVDRVVVGRGPVGPLGRIE